MCLLRGTYVHDCITDDNPILEGYDSKLSAAKAQPTTAILKVMDELIRYPSSIKLQNAWLSLYANNRNGSPHDSAIPAMWSPDCVSITSNRLDLYDRGRVSPELGLVTFFLSCPVALIACRALRWYLHLHEDARICSSTQHLISLPIIFRRGLSVEENCDSWLLLVDVIIPKWGEMPPEGTGGHLLLRLSLGTEAHERKTQP